ncbi:hypothetical protein ACTMU2_23300 [Cupriavidus basilensis]
MLTYADNSLAWLPAGTTRQRTFLRERTRREDQPQREWWDMRRARMPAKASACSSAKRRLGEVCDGRCLLEAAIEQLQIARKAGDGGALHALSGGSARACTSSSANTARKSRTIRAC